MTFSLHLTCQVSRLVYQASLLTDHLSLSSRRCEVTTDVESTVVVVVVVAAAAASSTRPLTS